MMDWIFIGGMLCGVATTAVCVLAVLIALAMARSSSRDSRAEDDEFTGV